MRAPDPERIGGLAWTRRTKGRLTSRERRRLLGEIVRGQAGYVAGRIKLATGRTPAGAADLSARDLRPPDSALARVTEEACREQPQAIIGHGYRTWMFGAGLAALDRNELEPELFYSACLLHDHGLADPVQGEDFTLRSVQRLERCGEEAGASSEDIAAAAQAITVHASPGARVEEDGVLGFYIQAGAMLDLVGMRAADLSGEYREHVIREHPRDGVTREIVALIRAESRANPEGRFALLRRCGFTAIVRVNPLRPR